MKFKRACLITYILSLLISTSIASAEIFTGDGYIAKAFKIPGTDEVASGSILYQKGTFKDTVTFEGIVTGSLPANYTDYVYYSGRYNKVHSVTLPKIDSSKKDIYTEKYTSSANSAKMMLEYSNGTNYLICNQ
ncbi:MAG: hypothetical protein VZR23_08165 [Lachnospiraceae bacterium]|jgi:hypothetical protein|nr:hypothetical protein [Lachnospiraceae bacterium]